MAVDYTHTMATSKKSVKSVGLLGAHLEQKKNERELKKKKENFPQVVHIGSIGSGIVCEYSGGSSQGRRSLGKGADKKSG